MLSAKNLSKKYGNLTVLNNVSLNITQGEFITITGPSGAGKSTLLHLLSSLDTPDTGTVTINNQNLFARNNKQQAQFRNKHLGFIFQFHHLLPEFTAIENVCMPLWIAKTDKNKAIEKAKKTLDIVGLSHRLSHKPTELSGGEQQRVAIARAIVHQPSIVFADEPTGNLDTANANAIHDLFFHLNKEFHLTFVIVTHNEQLAQLAGKVLKMKDGKIMDNG